MQLQNIPNYPDRIDEKVLEKSPFKFTTGIAEFSTNAEFGTGFLVPTVHTTLIMAAEFDGKPLSFAVPKIDPTTNEKGIHLFDSSLWIKPDKGRHAPEFIHIRRQQIDDRTIRDLNDDETMLDILVNADPLKFRARHFVDFTGDGWVEATCSQLHGNFPDQIPAYSLITAPDFFPNVDQGELADWALNSDIQKIVRNEHWIRRIAPLSDSRKPANLELKSLSSGNSVFGKDDITVTAIVCLPIKDRIQRPFIKNMMRNAYLPDAASSEFAPGWDTSEDNGHLAAYGLGSPFPEDSKLCAALSSFWPAVAPDAIPIKISILTYY